MHATTSSPAEACSPESWDGPNASARTPEWLAYCFARLILLILKAFLSRHTRRASAPPGWLHDRPDLPAGSAQAEAASVRGSFGTSIRWMCLRHGIGPGHQDWPELSRAIVAFGGSLAGFRAGAPQRGEWWEDPNVVPGMVPFAGASAAASASLPRPQAVANPAPPAPNAAPALLRAIRQRAFARAATRATTGPPTGPPATCGYQTLTPDARGQPMASPAVLIRAA